VLHRCDQQECGEFLCTVYFICNLALFVQENGFKPFVGLFVVHICDLVKCAEFLHIYSQTFAPCMQGNGNLGLKI
jgi:hypothetical protein